MLDYNKYIVLIIIICYNRYYIIDIIKDIIKVINYNNY